MKHLYRNLDLPSIVQVNTGAGRYYETPEGKHYPSVTSVTGLSSREAIQAWRKRVGEEEANRVTSTASKRGSAVHYLCEQYLKEGRCKPSLVDVEMFQSLQPVLDTVEEIYAIEQALYSDHLRTAGTVDLIAKIGGKRYIIDFKTSAKPKKREWCHSYFMQCAAYAVMFEERTGIATSRLMIIMGVDHQEPIIMTEQRDDWIGEFQKWRDVYKSEIGF